MSQSLSYPAPGGIMLRGQLPWVLTLLAAVAVGANEAPLHLRQDVVAQLRRHIANGDDVHDVSLSLGGWESYYRKAPDDEKLAFIKETLNLTALSLGGCDPSLHAFFDIGSEPGFDWQKYRIKPIFSGESPDAIENAQARDAYKKALAQHKELLVRVSKEKLKLQESDYCAGVAARVFQASENRAQLRNAIERHINDLEAALWIKARLIRLTFANSGQGTSPPNSPPVSGAASVGLSANSGPTTNVGSAARAGESERMSVTPSDQKPSSLAWIGWVILVVVLIGLSWFAFAKRSKS